MANFWDNDPVVSAPQPKASGNFWQNDPVVGAGGEQTAAPGKVNMDGSQPAGHPTAFRAGEGGNDPTTRTAAEAFLPAMDAAVRGAANTATLGVADRFAAMGNLLTGHAKDYSSGLQDQRGFDKQAETDHPIAYVGGELAGGLAAPEMGLVKGAGLAKGLTEGAFQGGVSGAMNADDSAGDSKLGGAIKGAMLGSALGAAMPVAAKGGSLAREIGGAFTDPNGEGYAMRKIGEAAQKGGTDIPSAVQGVGDARTTAPDWVMADQLGNPGARLAGSAIRDGSEGGEALRQQFTDRQLASGDRVKGIFGDALGDPAKYHGTLDDAVAGMKTRAKPFYTAAENTPIDYAAHPELQNFFERVPPQAVNEANKIMKVDGETSNLLKQNPDGSLDQSSQPNMKQWNYLKQGMDTVINGTEGKGISGGLTPYGARVTGLKNDTLGVLDQAVPDYATARSIFKGDADVRDALETGRGALSADPEAVTSTINDMSDAEKVAHGIGLSRALGDKVDATKGVGDTLANVWNSPIMRNRVEAGVGHPAVFDILSNKLGQEGAMSRTFQKSNSNSATAERLGDDADMAGSGAAEFGTRLFTRGIWNALYGAGVQGARKLNMGMTDGRADQIAKDLGSDGQDLLQRFESSKDGEARLSAIANAFNNGGSKLGRAAVLAGQNR